MINSKKLLAVVRTTAIFSLLVMALPLQAMEQQPNKPVIKDSDLRILMHFRNDHGILPEIGSNIARYCFGIDHYNGLVKTHSLSMNCATPSAFLLSIRLLDTSARSIFCGENVATKQ